jgi:hypothetical protein
MRGGLGRRVADAFAVLRRFEEEFRMAESMAVAAFLPGAAVVLADDIPAKVLSVQLRVAGALAYEVAWWDGNTRHSQWVEPQEVKAGKGASPTRLGFIPPEGT